MKTAPPDEDAADAQGDLPSLATPPAEPREVEPRDVEPVPEPQSVELVFWDSIKDSTRAADYEAYLAQYPKGSFLALARTRREAIASASGAMRDPQDREIELAFWESARESDNPASLEAYLDKYPEGEFTALAEICLAELGAARRSAAAPALRKLVVLAAGILALRRIDGAGMVDIAGRAGRERERAEQNDRQPSQPHLDRPHVSPQGSGLQRARRRGFEPDAARVIDRVFHRPAIAGRERLVRRTRRGLRTSGQRRQRDRHQ